MRNIPILLEDCLKLIEGDGSQGEEAIASLAKRLRHELGMDIMTARELIDEAKEAEKFYPYESDGVVYFDEGYTVDLDTCKNYGDIMEWVMHLLEKAWMDPLHVRSFIQMATVKIGQGIFWPGRGRKAKKPARPCRLTKKP